MFSMILLAYLNGIAVSIGRVLEARLAMVRGPFVSSAVSHLAAFTVLLALVGTLDGFSYVALLAEVPRSTYISGLSSAAFVVLSSWVIPRIGAMKGILLIVAGQMLCAALVDAAMGRVKSLPMELLGIALIVAGVNILHYAVRRSA